MKKQAAAVFDGVASANKKSTNCSYRVVTAKCITASNLSLQNVKLK